jgi:hypothetical protein
MAEMFVQSITSPFYHHPKKLSSIIYLLFIEYGITHSTPELHGSLKEPDGIINFTS